MKIIQPNFMWLGSSIFSTNMKVGWLFQHLHKVAWITPIVTISKLSMYIICRWCAFNGFLWYGYIGRCIKNEQENWQLLISSKINILTMKSQGCFIFCFISVHLQSMSHKIWKIMSENIWLNPPKTYTPTSLDKIE